MTSETIELTREQAQANIAEAESKANEARAAFDAYMQEHGAQAELGEVKKLSDAAVSAKGAHDRAVKALESVESNERWHAISDTNRGIIDAIEAVAAKGLPNVKITGLNGSADIAEDGTVSVKATVVLEDVSTDDLAAAIRSHIEANRDVYVGYSINGLTFSAEKLGTKEFNASDSISVRPKGVRAATTRVSSGTGVSRGRLLFNGLKAREYLESMESKYGDTHQKAFETALRGTGNGLSNLAKAIAAKEGIVPTEAPKDE